VGWAFCGTIAYDCVLTGIGDYIKVTCETSTLTQYFVVHNGDPIIHMATYITAGIFPYSAWLIVSDC
jgi:hypothetical protein